MAAGLRLGGEERLSNGGGRRRRRRGIDVISTHGCFPRLNASSAYIAGRRE
jgi:hypothetical protein